MFSIGKWMSRRRCQGRILQEYLKKKFRRSLQIRLVANFMLL